MSDHAKNQRLKAARQLARKLDGAAAAMDRYLEKCRTCNDGTGPKEIDDSRVKLRRDMREFANFLALRYPEVRRADP
jgi:hypothetical protein